MTNKQRQCKRMLNQIFRHMKIYKRNLDEGKLAEALEELDFMNSKLSQILERGDPNVTVNDNKRKWKRRNNIRRRTSPKHNRED